MESWYWLMKLKSIELLTPYGLRIAKGQFRLDADNCHKAEKENFLF